jgi:hypothetical protein
MQPIIMQVGLNTIGDGRLACPRHSGEPQQQRAVTFQVGVVLAHNFEAVG